MPPNVKIFCFNESMEDSLELRKKIPYFLGYRKLSKSVLKDNEFDLIIVLHSTPGVLLTDILTSKYSGKYILDYRDYTYENISFYKKIIQRLVTKSIVTFSSSRGYLENFDNSNVYISHNLSRDIVNQNSLDKVRSQELPIIIRFWGFVRHVKINKLIIDKLGNDERFELHYHGRMQKEGLELQEHVGNYKISNVYFHGEYIPSERSLFAAKTDILHNIYDNDRKTINAMGNKFYDGVMFQIPQICNLDSFMGKEVEQRGLGLMVNPSSENFADSIFDYYSKINWSQFESNCKENLEKITEEYNLGVSKINEILSSDSSK